MSTFIARRLAFLVFVTFMVSTLVFFFIHFIPGDPLAIMLGDTARAADVAELRTQMGLDRPLGEQYVRFLRGLVHGDLGRSLRYDKPVMEMVLARLPATLELATAAMIIAILIAIPAGIMSAIRPYSAFDHGSMFLSLVGVSMPSFWLGPLLILAFAIHLDWFPVSGRAGISSLVLPAITLGTALAAILSRMTRSAMLEVIREEYITAGRAKGLTERTLILKHGFRNALIPVLTVLGLQIGALLSGAVVTEKVFAWPGIGRLLVDGIEARDYPLVQGCVLAISLSYVLVNLAIDLLYAAVDPRIRME
ncbi:MAG: ABC transporter permease [Deltaproteobacteria bacterium]|nr:ABC transporter permease [Deltaproteobacteria bacterium]